MTDGSKSAGGSVVGRLGDAVPWEADLILAMRLWMDSPEGQAEVWNEFARCFGAEHGRAELRHFETLLTHLCTHARRPLVRHGLCCDCIGSDEAILQTLVREAVRGDLAEAALIASLILPACHAEPVALLAARVGQAMQRMARHLPPLPRRPKAGSRTMLH